MAADRLTLALAQISPVVGDIDGNRARLAAARAEAAGFGADLVLAPELFLCGYPPEDLVLKPAFQEACRTACEALARETADGGPAVLVGLPWVEDGALYNAVALLNGGRIEAVRFKVDLPNYGVFDEKRVFRPGPHPGPIAFKGVRIGVPICEDIWGPDPVECIAETGGEILLVPNASPYERDKLAVRRRIAEARVRGIRPAADLSQQRRRPGRAGVRGRLVRAPGRWLARLPAARLPRVRRQDGVGARAGRLALRRGAAETRCCRATRAITPPACSACATMSSATASPAWCWDCRAASIPRCARRWRSTRSARERVHAVMLPYKYTSGESLRDAEACAKALGVRYDVMPIAEPVEAFERALAPMFAGRPRDITEENIQSRTRGLILMSISNKFGAMVVTTGNKSEMSVGYATLYGDMNGGFNPIKDLYKMEVFRLSRAAQPLEARGRARTRRGGDPARRSSTSRRPRNCATTRRTRISLPPYPVLDAILHGLVEREMRVADIVAQGFALETVQRVERLLYLAEYKRRQSAPGVKVGPKNFGRDRRYPIVNRFRDAGGPMREPDAAVAPKGMQGGAERFED